VNALAYARNGILAAGLEGNKVILLSPNQVRHFPTAGKVTSVAFSPNGTYLAAGLATNRGMVTWNLQTGARDTFWSDSPVFTIDFSPDSNRLTAGLANGDILTWNIFTKRKILPLPTGSWVQSITYMGNQ
jgi:WD40 repeat protein